MGQPNQQPEPKPYDELDELHAYVAFLNAEFAREGKPHASIALAKVMERIRKMQARRP